MKTLALNTFKTLSALALFAGLSLGSYAQSEELKQKISAFKSDLEGYEMKYLNIGDRELGSIYETGFDWKDEFMLKALEKQQNNLGSNGYPKFYFSIFSYETIDDRKYALKDWMESFIEGSTLRAGRDIRTLQYATPTIILINDLEIITCNYKCKDYSEDNFDTWKDMLLKYFGADNTMVLEVMCDGPVEWTKNVPDPKDRRNMP